MDGISTVVNAGLAGLPAELLLIVPAGLLVTAVTWGAPKAVRFFKAIAR